MNLVQLRRSSGAMMPCLRLHGRYSLAAGGFSMEWKDPSYASQLTVRAYCQQAGAVSLFVIVIRN